MSLATLLVQQDSTSIQTLRYFLRNIRTINQMGVTVRAVHVRGDLDSHTSDIFAKKGIHRLPALITPDGVVYIGHRDITSVFSRNVTRDRYDRMISSADHDAVDTRTQTFWNNELYEGMDSDGRPIPRKDADVDDEAILKSEIDKKLGAYSKSVPAHRRSDYNPPARETPAPSAPHPQPPRRDNRVGGDLDDELLAAWMSNQEETPV